MTIYKVVRFNEDYGPGLILGYFQKREDAEKFVKMSHLTGKYEINEIWVN